MQRHLVRTGSSYMSQSQVQPLIRLGDATEIESVTVTAPDGTRREVAAAVNRTVSVQRGR